MKKFTLIYSLNFKMIFLLLMASAFYSNGIFAKSINKLDTIPRESTRPDVAAQFTGAGNTLRMFLLRNVTEDIPYKNYAPVGKYQAFVRFRIDTTGAVDDVVILKDPGYGTAEELVRIIKLSSGKWIPAVLNGIKVNSYIGQPLTFSVDKQRPRQPIQ